MLLVNDLLLLLVLEGRLRANYNFLMRFISCGLIFALHITMLIFQITIRFSWRFLLKFDMFAHILIR